MTDLSPHELRQLLIASANETLSVRVDDVDVTSGTDWTGSPAYFIAYQIKTGADREKASRLRTRLTQTVRDTLVKRNDPHYPFVRLLEERDWTRRHAEAG